MEFYGLHGNKFKIVILQDLNEMQAITNKQLNDTRKTMQEQNWEMNIQIFCQITWNKWAWWHTPINSEFKKWMQEYQEFQDNLRFILRLRPTRDTLDPASEMKRKKRKEWSHGTEILGADIITKLCRRTSNLEKKLFQISQLKQQEEKERG